ncbi:hypothetical protein C8Q79DRAFT_10091 [Trametes meyenii]|nr:hypothetical protein C8Q79DRAFT_10091 [Trametes meyenii]
MMSDQCDRKVIQFSHHQLHVKRLQGFCKTTTLSLDEIQCCCVCICGRRWLSTLRLTEAREPRRFGVSSRSLVPTRDIRCFSGTVCFLKVSHFDVMSLRSRVPDAQVFFNSHSGSRRKLRTSVCLNFHAICRPATPLETRHSSK